MNVDCFKADVMRAAEACGVGPMGVFTIMTIVGPPGSDQRRKFNVLLNLIDFGFEDPEVKKAVIMETFNDHSR